MCSSQQFTRSRAWPQPHEEVDLGSRFAPGAHAQLRPGAKPIVVSDEYYPALAMDHVQLHPSGVTSLTRTAVVSANGAETPADIVIFCTGYRLGGRESGKLDVNVYRRCEHIGTALARRPEACRGVIPTTSPAGSGCCLSGI